MTSFFLNERKQEQESRFFWSNPNGRVSALDGYLYAIVDIKESGEVIRIELNFLESDLSDNGLSLPKSDTSLNFDGDFDPILTISENKVVSEITWLQRNKSEIVLNKVSEASLLLDDSGQAVGVSVKDI
jgi:hypothetical protein